MKHSNQNSVNAGSMADIAFLLLIFFLVSTTIQSDEGINQKLPPKCIGKNCEAKTKEHNIINISINKDNDLMVKNKVTSAKELKTIVKQFIDNNGDNSCEYCNGNKTSDASDNPQKAVISLRTDREASNKTFVTIQNVLMESYNELRNDYALKKYNKILSDLTKNELIIIKKAYPQIISEAEVN